MMNSRLTLDNQSAVVLHHYNYRDSSLIVNFFLSDMGKISAIAKGVKGKKSKHSQLVILQPFQKLKISLSGKQELLYLKNFELTTQFDHEADTGTDLTASSGWNLSGKSLYCAYYINELLLRLLPSHTDCNEIFTLYDQILNVLSDISAQQISNQHISDKEQSRFSVQYEVPLRIFELKLLDYLGYGLNFSHDFQSNLAVDDKKQYYYVIDSGPSELPVNGVKYLMISGRTLLSLANGQITDQKTLQQSKQLLKWALAEHLGHKPLKSREIFKQLYC